MHLGEFGVRVTIRHIVRGIPHRCLLGGPAAAGAIQTSLNGVTQAVQVEATMLLILEFHPRRNKLIREAQSLGVDSLIDATPQSLGDNYEEMILSRQEQYKGSTQGVAVSDGYETFRKAVEQFFAGGFTLHDEAIANVACAFRNGPIEDLLPVRGETASSDTEGPGCVLLEHHGVQPQVLSAVGSIAGLIATASAG